MMFLTQWKEDSQGDFGVVNGILEQKNTTTKRKKSIISNVLIRKTLMIRIFSPIESFLFPLFYCVLDLFCLL